jgi:hypothetical protein
MRRCESDVCTRDALTGPQNTVTGDGSGDDGLRHHSADRLCYTFGLLHEIAMNCTIEPQPWFQGPN